MFGAVLISRLIDFFVGLAEIILGLRILLRLLAANPSTPFVTWIYDLSQTLLSPFRGIFPSATIGPGAVLDVSAFFAMIVYALAGYLVQELLAMVSASSKRG